MHKTLVDERRWAEECEERFQQSRLGKVFDEPRATDGPYLFADVLEQGPNVSRKPLLRGIRFALLIESGVAFLIWAAWWWL